MRGRLSPHWPPFLLPRFNIGYTSLRAAAKQSSRLLGAGLLRRFAPRNDGNAGYNPAPMAPAAKAKLSSMPSLRRMALVRAIVIAVLIVIPYLIAPFYRFVDPVSMPMLWRWAIGARVERVWVPLDRISPALP